MPPFLRGAPHMARFRNAPGAPALFLARRFRFVVNEVSDVLIPQSYPSLPVPSLCPLLRVTLEPVPRRFRRHGENPHLGRSCNRMEKGTAGARYS